MGPNASEILAEEAGGRNRAAFAAFVAGALTLAGGILAALAYRDLPDVQLIGSLREHLTPQPGAGPGLKARQALFYHKHATELIGVATMLAVGVAAIGVALVYLYRVTKARRIELPKAAVVAAIAGAVTVAVAGITQAVGVSVKASSFAGSHDQSAHAARDVLQAPVVIASLILRQVGVFALGFAFIMIALNAMRVGLLTRFMGVLGIIVGVLFVVPLGSSLPIVQSFWLLALGVLFLHRWPNGMPPAWTTGEARPWPSQIDLREAREKAKAKSAPASKPVEDKPADGKPSDKRRLPEAPAPSKPAHSSSKKRGRKRRSG